MYRTVLTTSALALSLIGLSERPASAQLMPTAQVANLIAKVENGVDDFRNYREKRGGADAARLWGVLRTGVNDLARANGVPPMAI